MSICMPVSGFTWSIQIYNMYNTSTVITILDGWLLTTTSMLEGLLVWCTVSSVQQSRQKVMSKKFGLQLGKLCSLWWWEIVSKWDQSGIWFVWIANSSLFATPPTRATLSTVWGDWVGKSVERFPCRSEHLKANFLNLPWDLNAPLPHGKSFWVRDVE